MKQTSNMEGRGKCTGNEGKYGIKAFPLSSFSSSASSLYLLSCKDYLVFIKTPKLTPWSEFGSELY
jgi:hypothetical protein